MKDQLDQLTDAQLSEALAVEVAGWKWIVKPTGFSWLVSPDGNWEVPQGHDLTTFATSADAVLVHADDYLAFTAERVIAGWTVRVCYRGQQTKDNPLAHCYAYATAKTFARAACIALIRAKRASQPTN